MTSSQKTPYIENWNRIHSEINGRKREVNAKMEALIKQCQRAQCSYTNTLSHCKTCNRRVYARSAYTSYKVPVLVTNRRAVPAETPAETPADAGWKQEWNDMFNADTATINHLQVRFNRMAVNSALKTAFNHEIEKLGQESVRKLTERIRAENECARLKQVTDQRRAILARRKDLNYNCNLLTACIGEWKVYVRRLKTSPLYCPHCHSVVKHEARRAQLQRRKAVKSEVN